MSGPTDQHSIHHLPGSEPGNLSLQENREHQKGQSRHYIFEFFMLFLAVVCGFLAENWREQLADNQREEEYMRSMVEDLKSDTLESAKALMSLHKTQLVLDSVIESLASPHFIDNSNHAYRLWNKAHGFRDFISNDGTLQQLKAGGGLRLIGNRPVVDGIMKYDRLVQDFYTQLELMTSVLEDQRIYYQLFESITLDRDPRIPVPLNDQGKKMLNEAYANRKLWRFGISILISDLNIVNKEAGSLIGLIKEQYSFD